MKDNGTHNSIPLPKSKMCECKFCRPDHALTRISARLSHDEIAAGDLAEIRQGLERYYEETFEYQFDLDVIATALGIKDAIGVTRNIIMERICMLFPPFTDYPPYPGPA